MFIEVYTDGSATTKDKPGGWAYVIVIDGQKRHEGSGHIEKGTNNDAELQAAIEGLNYVKEYILTTYFLLQVPAGTIIDVNLVSDSQIVLGWADGSYAFRQESKIYKFKQLEFLVHIMKVQMRWVEGHTGDEHNERCDKLAKAARKGVEVTEEPPPSKLSKIGTKQSGVLCFFYKDILKIIDLDANMVEDYNEELHGLRTASRLELQVKS